MAFSGAVEYVETVETMEPENNYTLLTIRQDDGYLIKVQVITKAIPEIHIGYYVKVNGGTHWCKPPSGGSSHDIRPFLVEYPSIRVIRNTPIALKSIDETFSAKTIKELQNYIDSLKELYNSIVHRHSSKPNPPVDLKTQIDHVKLLIDGEIAILTKLIEAKRIIEDYPHHGVGYAGGSIVRLRELDKMVEI
jgi:hypothetical protein